MGRKFALSWTGAALAAMALGGCSGGAVPDAGSGAQACTPVAQSGAIISAHRGGAAYAPENTLPAFRNALRLGVDQLEMDTQLTADNQLVILHDATLDRTTECSGAVNGKTLAEVKACDAAYWFAPGQGVTTPTAALAHPLRGSGVQVPALKELLDWYVALPCGRPQLSIEIKNIPGETNFDPAGDKTAKVLLPLLAQYGLEKEIIIQSFWPVTLTQVKLLNPKLRTQFLTSSGSGQTAAANVAYVIASGQDIAAPNSDAPDLLTPLVQVAHAAGKLLLPYTPDTFADQQKTLGLGADGLITNFPACTLALLNRPVPVRIGADGVPETPACPGVAAPPVANLADRPSPATCAALRPSRWLAAAGHADANARLRVVGIQYKQEVRQVESYASFRTKMRCLMQDHVVPQMKSGLPMLVVFNEDIGLMTLATGTRGAIVRAQAATPLRGPLGDQAPLGIAAGLGLLNAAYAPQVAAYQAMFPGIDPRKEVFVAATDTFARAFSQTFSDIARDYGVYVVASNNMPHYRASKSPVEMTLFKDPDLASVDEVYVATSSHVANTTFLWGPADLHPEAPRGETNLLFANEKVPLTDIEKTLIGLDEGPSSGDAARTNAAGYSIEGFHLGFATSLPAFAWGYDFGQRPPALAPCADVHVSYMPCMDSLGVDVVVQAEANPGRWAANAAKGWQPLEWMNSTWRTVTEPSVKFRYNITPMLTGNLLDLPFDGQSAITGRGAGGASHYIGNLEFVTGTDAEAYHGYSGDQPGFLALAPWVTPDASRAALTATGTALSPGSNDPLENDYLETAVWADLVK
jgi:glycerophosphoryl diester phosphodiesterase